MRPERPQPRSCLWKGQGQGLRSGSRRLSACTLLCRTSPENVRGANRLFRREHSTTMLWQFAAVPARHETGGLVMATRKRKKRIKAASMTLRAMSKCAFKSPCGKLGGAVHGDDISLGGQRKLTSAVWASLREGFETRSNLWEKETSGAKQRLAARSSGQGRDCGWRQIYDM